MNILNYFRNNGKQPSLHKAMRYQKYFFGIALVALNIFNIYCHYYEYGFGSLGIYFMIFLIILFIPGIYIIVRTMRTPTRFDTDNDLIIITIAGFVILSLIFGTFDK